MGKTLGNALAGIVTALSAAEKPWRRADTRLRVREALVQRHLVETRRGPLVFETTHPQALQYPREFANFEPETLAWIDSFARPCRFWDVGANIGVFSLYAALADGVEVRAFEPAAASYAALCRNIETNRLGDRAHAYCIAIGERTELGSLNLSATNPGSVFNAFESERDCFGRALGVVFRQAAIGYAIDDFRHRFALPPPNYLKIDVDGTEEQVLAGTCATLRDPELRSVLIELEEAPTARNARLAAAVEGAGLGLSRRSAGGRGGVVNAIFTRCDRARGAA